MKIQSLERAFNIIEFIAETPVGKNLSEISKELSLPMSTVYRIVTDLQEKGYLEKDKVQNVYKIGLRFIDLSSLYLNNLELKTEAHPILMEVGQEVKFSIFMATLMDDEVCYIDRIDSFATIRGYSIIGQRRPVFSTSLGKALVLDWSEEKILQLVEKTGMYASTPYTITDPELFLENIRECRKRGWTMDDREDRLEFQCVGAPIYDYRNDIIAAVSISWDERFFGKVDPGEMAGIIQTAAQKISKRFGATLK